MTGRMGRRATAGRAIPRSARVDPPSTLSIPVRAEIISLPSPSAVQLAPTGLQPPELRQWTGVAWGEVALPARREAPPTVAPVARSEAPALVARPPRAPAALNLPRVLFSRIDPGRGCSASTPSGGEGGGSGLACAFIDAPSPSLPLCQLGPNQSVESWRRSVGVGLVRPAQVGRAECADYDPPSIARKPGELRSWATDTEQIGGMTDGDDLEDESVRIDEHLRAAADDGDEVVFGSNRGTAGATPKAAGSVAGGFLVFGSGITLGRSRPGSGSVWNTQE